VAQERAGFALLSMIASHPRILGVPFGDKEQRGSNPRSLLAALVQASPAALVIKPLELMPARTSGPPGSNSGTVCPIGPHCRA